MNNTSAENEIAKVAKNDVKDSVKDIVVASNGDPPPLCLQETQQKLSVIKTTQNAGEKSEKEYEQPEGEIVKPLQEENIELKPDENVKSMEDENIELKPEENVKLMEAENVKSMQDENVKSMPEENTKSMEDENVKSMDDESIKSMPDENIKSIPEENVKSMKAENIKSIPENIKSMPDENVKSMQDENIKSMQLTEKLTPNKCLINCRNQAAEVRRSQFVSKIPKPISKIRPMTKKENKKSNIPIKITAIDKADQEAGKQQSK